ncbi:hypothetical protein CCACVL1_25357, partial [Corchorus capsularis]
RLPEKMTCVVSNKPEAAQKVLTFQQCFDEH